MKIAISSVGDALESQVDQRFGRCPYFLIVDSETMSFKALVNEATRAMGGAGIKAAQSIAEEGVKAVLTGNVGPNAFQTLSAAGLDILTGISGTVRDAVEKFRRGELQSAGSPTVRGHFGLGQGARRGRGRRQS